MNARELSSLMGRLFPLDLQESYDNAGLQIEWGDQIVTGIMLALDLDAGVLGEARRCGANYIICHHPIFFKPPRCLTSDDAGGRLAMEAIAARISVYAAHTNLDKVYADRLARKLGMPVQSIIFSDGPVAHEAPGYGILAKLDQPRPLPAVLDLVAGRLDLEYLLFTGLDDHLVESLAILNGAGGSLVEKVLQQHSVDCIITGDVGYHHAKYARDRGVAVIDAGHFGTEKGFLKILRDDLVDHLTKSPDSAEVIVHIAESESNPLRLYHCQ